MKKIILMVISLFIISCSSTSSERHYYQLTSDFDVKPSLQVKKMNNFIWIESVDVVNFLDKTGIVYQTSSIEYVTANNNLWLTPLSNQLRERLIQDLSVLLPERMISIKPLSKPHTTVKLSIDGFHGSYTGDAIIKGHWLITNDKGEIVTKNFDYSLRLSKDGYQNLVETLSKGWQEEEIDLVRNVKL